MSGYLYPCRTYGGVEMFRDEIVEKVREVRQKHAARFNYDLRKIVEDLNNKQQQYERKTISFPPKPPRLQKTA